jgi:two-component system response regulator (stage 0 sporulation protein A)
MSGQKIGVLLVDGNQELCKTIADYISEQKDLQILGIAYNGWLAIEQIKKYHPDVLVLEIIIPGLDGIGVMERLTKLSQKPKVIVVTAFNRKPILDKLIKMGASYYMIKPVDFEMLLRVIRKFGREKKESELLVENNGKDLDDHFDLEFEVTRIFHNLGVPVHLRGYSYLREAIILVLKDEKLVGNLTKYLYPKIAKKYDITVASLESAIRHALITSWKRGNREYFEEIFEQEKSLTQRGKPPTIAEFISKIATIIRFQRF